MSTHAVPLSADPGGFLSAVSSEIRAPAWVAGDAAGSVVYTFVPDLTTDEVAVLAALVRAFRQHDVRITLAELQALEPHLATLRTFQQQSQAQFMALTATQRDRALFDVDTAIIRVLRALLRD